MAKNKKKKDEDVDADAIELPKKKAPMLVDVAKVQNNTNVTSNWGVVATPYQREPSAYSSKNLINVS